MFNFSGLEAIRTDYIENNLYNEYIDVKLILKKRSNIHKVGTHSMPCLLLVWNNIRRSNLSHIVAKAKVDVESGVNIVP